MFQDTQSTRSASRTILFYGLCLFCCGAIFSLVGLHSEANAGTLTQNYVDSFGATAPDGPAPYATSFFDDGGSAGTVTLTIDVAATVGEADVAALYYSLDPSLDATDLSIVRTGGDGPIAGDISISLGTDAFQADGDGLYDILIDLPPPPGSQSARFQAGETLVFAISGIPTLVAADFDFLAAPGGGAGPYKSVARFLSTGEGGEDSDWVGTPEPSTLLLTGLGSLALVARRRRARA